MGQGEQRRGRSLGESILPRTRSPGRLQRRRRWHNRGPKASVGRAPRTGLVLQVGTRKPNMLRVRRKVQDPSGRIFPKVGLWSSYKEMLLGERESWPSKFKQKLFPKAGCQSQCLLLHGLEEPSTELEVGGAQVDSDLPGTDPLEGCGPTDSGLGEEATHLLRPGAPSASFWLLVKGLLRGHRQIYDGFSPLHHLRLAKDLEFFFYFR
nr:uncharacterized protein LOC129393071 [Pan paniscus]